MLVFLQCDVQCKIHDKTSNTKRVAVLMLGCRSGNCVELTCVKASLQYAQKANPHSESMAVLLNNTLVLVWLVEKGARARLRSHFSIKGNLHTIIPPQKIHWRRKTESVKENQVNS